MIVSASYRTDIPALYGEWFMNRLAAGYARVRNPYGGPDTVVSLAAADVTGFVFWTRNAGPFMPALAAVTCRSLPFILHHTALGYPRALDPATIPAERAIANMREVARRYGSAGVVWRYDPIVWTSITEPAWHETNFHKLCTLVSGVTDEVVVSCLQVYRKSARNLDRAAGRKRFYWRDPPADEKRALLRRLAIIAVDYGLRMTVCGQPDLITAGVGEARCIDVSRLSRVANKAIAALPKPHRPSCACSTSRDIGAYESCPFGCAYCYAVTSREVARRRLRNHDPHAEFLI